MLQKLRASVSGILGIALILLLVVAFAVWGIADSFTSMSSSVVAEVGDQSVSTDEYRLRYNQQLQALSRQLDQPISREQGISLGIPQQVLKTMIGMAALNNATDNMDLAISDKAIANLILDDPAFHGPNAKFDETTFRNVLRQNGLTEKLFTQDQRSFATRSQLLDATVNIASIPKPLLSRIYNFVLEQRVAKYIIISPESVGEIGEPSEQELVDFYTNSKLRFSEPERRRATILAITPSRFAETLTISEDDLLAEYDYRQSEYITPELREIDQLLISDEANIEIAQKMLAGKKPFAQIVRAVGQTLDNTDIGLVSRDDIISAELADEAFKVEKGQLSDLIEGPLGTVIIRVRDIQPGETKPFEDVREDLLADVKSIKAAEELISFSELIIDELAAGERYEDIAQKFDLEINSIAATDRAGNQANGGRSPVLEKYSETLERIFDADIADDIPMLELSDGSTYWVRLDEIIEPYSKPLNEIREEVITQWKALEKTTLLEAMAVNLVETGNKTGSFKDVEKSLDQKAFLSEPMTRQLRNETFSADSMAKLFDASDKEFVWGPVGFGESLIVMQVSRVLLPSENNPKAFGKISTSETEKYRLDMTNQLVSALEKSFGIKMDAQGLEQALTLN